VISKGDESTGADTSSAADVCGELTTVARLSLHVKNNNIAYLVGMLIAYQIGIMDKVFTFGSGLC
jgi:hypothetical protein